jgi:hypothetical protein
MARNSEFNNYWPIAGIIAIIIIVSFFYQQAYSNEEYLQVNSMQQLLVSGITSIFNGYTETLTSQANFIGKNIFTNIGFTIILLLALWLLEHFTKNEDRIPAVIKLMLLAQFVFVPIWWYFHKNFSGGLSLWNTFILFVLIFELLSPHNYGNLDQKASNIFHTNIICIIFMALASFSLNINLLLYQLFGVIMFITGIIIWIIPLKHYRSRKKLFLIYSSPLIVGLLIGILLGFFLLPIVGKEILLYNPHLLALPIFVSLFLIYKLKYKNSPISMR